MLAIPRSRGEGGSGDAPRSANKLLRAWAIVAAFLVAGRLAAPYIPALADSVLLGGLAHRIVEIWLVAGITLWAVPPTFILRMMRQLHSVRLLVLLLVGAMVMIGQYGYRHMDLYPFVEWGMYSSLTDRIVYSDYRMVGRGEVIERLPLAELVPTDMRGFMSRVDDRIAEAAEGDEDAQALVQDTFASLVAQSGAPGVEAVLVLQCVVEDPSVERPVSCRPILTVPVGSPTV